MRSTVAGALRIAAFTIGALVVVVALIVTASWLDIRSTPQDLVVQQGRDAGDRIEAQVMQLADGETFEFGAAVGRPWERAVLVGAYANGDEMNEIVGFDWWPSDHLSGSDESQSMLAFIAGDAVVAQVHVGPDTFRLVHPVFEEGDVAFVEFVPSHAAFVASRGADGLVTLSRP